MTFLASSAAALFQQITLWTGRANQAWGASRVWNTGQSFEVDRNAAYDGGTWGVGNLWSTDAHNDPNVWTNRYNAGVTDGSTAAAPPAAVVQKSASAVFARASQGVQQATTAASVVLDRVGQWVLVASTNCVDTSFGSNAQNSCALFFKGVQQGAMATTDVPSNTNNWTIHNGARLGPPLVVVTTTDVTSVASVNGSAADNNGGQRNATCFIDAFFIPITAHPH